MVDRSTILAVARSRRKLAATHAADLAELERMFRAEIAALRQEMQEDRKRLEAVARQARNELAQVVRTFATERDFSESLH